jgi:hypothetical protein
LSHHIEQSAVLRRRQGRRLASFVDTCDGPLDGRSPTVIVTRVGRCGRRC